MLGHALLGNEIGVDTVHVGHTFPERAGSISSVVDQFLRIDAGFSDAEIQGYINTALVNEAVDLWHGRIESEAAINIWRHHVERSTGGFEDVGVAEATRRLEAMIRDENQEYAKSRTEFGKASLAAVRSGRVTLAPETRAWFATLDNDGHITSSIDFDVEAILGKTCLSQGNEALSPGTSDNPYGTVNPMLELAHKIPTN